MLFPVVPPGSSEPDPPDPPELFGLSVSRFRVRDDNPNGPGSVDVYLANPAGPATA